MNEHPIRLENTSHLPIPAPRTRSKIERAKTEHVSTERASTERAITGHPHDPRPNLINSAESKWVDPTSAATVDGELETHAEWIVIDRESQAGLVEDLRKSRGLIPGWLVSFSLHVILLLGLAVFGLRGSLDESISLTASASDGMNLEAMSDAVAEVDFQLPAYSEPSSTVENELRPTDQTDLGGPNEARLDLGAGNVYAGQGFGEMGNGFASIAGEGVAMKPSELAAARKAEAKDRSAEFFGVSARGNKFVYVLDCSGSMFGPRWELTKRELFRSLDGLGPEHRFLVLLYNGGTWAMFNTTPEQTFMVEASDENVLKLKQWVNRQYPGGSTYPRRAMASALYVEPDAVFLLSDGEFQDDTVDFLAFANVPKDRGNGMEQKIPIHTLAMDFSEGVLYLRQIAAQNDGQFRLVNSN